MRVVSKMRVALWMGARSHRFLLLSNRLNGLAANVIERSGSEVL